MKKVIEISAYAICFLYPIFCYNVTFGATLLVPGEYPTIQSGIDAAQSGDSVIVGLGTYHENIDFNGKNITVSSQSGPNETIINGGRSGSVVTFWNGEANNAILNGFTITNGIPLESMERIYPFGGGISIRNASPTIAYCTITGNAANDGGGIHVVGYQASPIIENNTISGNIAPYVGGGIVARDGASPVIRGNIITENFTMQGSGIFISNDASPLIEDNVLQSNDGGWCCMGRQEALQFLDGIDIRENMGCGNFFPSTILVANRSSPVIRNNTITNNTSGGIGVFLNSSPIIDGNTIADNHGPHFLAGGLFVAINANPIVINNTIQGNQGSALWVDNSSSIRDVENHPISLTGFHVIEDADKTVTYFGNWDLGTGKVYSGGTVRMEGEAGSMASLTFTGTGISLIYFADASAGKAGIRIDGIDYPPVDMYCPESMQYGKTEHVITTNLSSSEHTLTVTVSGDKNPLSSGTGIALDAVGVLSGTTVGENTVLGAVYWQPTLFPQSDISSDTILLVPDHHATIQSAMDAANAGDTIIVAPGTYQENLDFRGKNITLRSQNPDHAETVASTIIDANEVWPTIMFASGETRECALEGFTLNNSLGEKIVQISGASPVISKNIIKNTTDSGINCDYAEAPLIIANTFESNDADSDSVINCHFSTPLISGNRFSDNRSISISTYFSHPLILGNTFIDNKKVPLYMDHLSTATIQGNTITGTGPLTDHMGCGIVLDFFSDCIIEGNTITDNQGDGIFMIIDSSPVITNNIIARNGEGLNVGGSHPVLMNNTIVDNPNGIYIRDISRALITNSILLNDFDIGTEPYAEVSVTYSNVKNGYEGVGNISEDPLFADSDDYHLSGNSPCIDSGTPLNAPDTDINGTTRPQNEGYDMGAHEYDVTPPEIYTTFPQNGANDVDVNIEVSAQFSENMDAATFTTASFKVNDESMDIPALVTCNGNTATLFPATNLSFDTTYTATLTTALQDPAGNALTDSYTWNFTTCQGQMYYRDSDEDGYGDPSDSIQSCSVPPGYVTDYSDNCPNDPTKIEPGICGCGVSDIDTDSDGAPDCIDLWPEDPSEWADNDEDGIGDNADLDDDEDGIPDDWEEFYGLDPLTNDAFEDADNDGFSNLEEYEIGSNPRNRNDPEPKAMPWIPILLE